MTSLLDTVVVGGGAMGSAAAWQLARRGTDVTLFERFAPGHVQGASHGSSRNFNLAYGNPVYLGLLAEALRDWRELEGEAGASLLDQVGIVTHGAHPELDLVTTALHEFGFEAEIVDATAAAGRWPGLRFAGPVLHTPQAGRLDANAAVAALQRAAGARGASINHLSRVTSITVLGDDRVRLEVTHTDEAGAPASEEVVECRRLVVTLGAWTAKLLGASVALPRLVVTQEQPLHFAVRDETLDWPGFNHLPSAVDLLSGWYAPVYGMFTPGVGVKAGWHGTGVVTDPDRRTFAAEPRQREALQQYAREWLPGVDAESVTEISCTYTTTPDSNFIVDRVGPVVVAAGFSGHGFKFTPAIGGLIADLVQGGRAPQLFSLAAVRG